MSGNATCCACRQRLSKYTASFRASQHHPLFDVSSRRHHLSSRDIATNYVGQAYQHVDARRASGVAGRLGGSYANTRRIVARHANLYILQRTNTSQETAQFQAPRSEPSSTSKISTQTVTFRTGDNRDASTAQLQVRHPQEKATLESRLVREEGHRWGYLRHQLPDDFSADQNNFNIWKGWIRAITLNKERSLLFAPWRDDGNELAGLESTQAMLDAWNQLDVEERREFWPGVMLSILNNNRHQASQVLAATLDPLPQGYALADVLDLIANGLSGRQLKDDKNIHEADQLLHLLLRLIHHTPSGYIPFPQRSLGKFGKQFPPHHASELYRALKEAGITLHPHTRLHFASTLAGTATVSQYKDEAFEILRELGDSSENFTKPQFASVLTSLLKCGPSGDTQTDEFSPLKAMEHFMETGYVPNIITFTAFCTSLCRRREWTEATRLAKIFSNNVQPLDSKMLRTVLNGAKSSLSVVNVREALGMPRQLEERKKEIFNNALHAVFYFADTEFALHPEPLELDRQPFVSMLALYNKKFDLEPLQWLVPETLPMLLEKYRGNIGIYDEKSPRRRFDFEYSIVPVVNDFFAASGHLKMRPSTTTLSIMLRAYIKSLRHPYDLMSFYTFFTTRLTAFGKTQRKRKSALLDQGSIIHDTLIQAMLKQDGLTRPALEIFGDMLKERIRALDEKNRGARSASSRIIAHPEPSVFTFSILLHSLFLRKETALVEQILKVMRENGVEANLVTWNTLIGGYAFMQNVPKTVEALRELEAAGYAPDEYTYRAFAKLRKQKEALIMIQEIITRNAQTIEEQNISTK